mgnify:FL=1
MLSKERHQTATGPIYLLWDREQTTKIFIGERQEAISGIFVDTVALIAKEAGLTYDFVSDPDEADVLVGMLNGDEPLFPGYRRAINAYQPDTEKRGKLLKKIREGSRLNVQYSFDVDFSKPSVSDRPADVGKTMRRLATIKLQIGDTNFGNIKSLAAMTFMGPFDLALVGECEGYIGLLGFKKSYLDLQYNDIAFLKHLYR